MTDLERRFRTLETVPVPDLWNEIQRRAEAPALSTQRIAAHSVTIPGPLRAPATRPRVSLGLALALVGLILLAMTGAFVGAGILFDEASPTPRLTPAPSAPASSLPATPGPTTSGATQAPTVTARPTHGIGITSGQAETALGPVEWTLLIGPPDTLPMGPITATANGFAAVEGDPDGQGARLWLSDDGVGWTVREIPIAAAGEVSHVVSGGRHWIWTNDVHLWESADLENWNEVDLSEYRLPPDEGLRIFHDFVGPWVGPFHMVTAGDSSLLQLEVRAMIESDVLAEGFGFTSNSDGFFYVVARPEGDDGNVISVWRQQPDTLSRVGDIRVEVDGTGVAISDAARGTRIVTIDAAALGLDPSELATKLLDEREVKLRQHAIAIADGVARPVQFLDHVEVMGALSGGFFAVTHDGGTYEVWSSPNGEAWESLGAPNWPSPPGVNFNIETVVEDLWIEPGVVVAAWLDDAESGLRVEIWSTDDGLAWTQAGVLPADYLTTPYRVPGGYMAVGDNDSRLYFSPGGSVWTDIAGRPGTDGLLGEPYWPRTVSATEQVAFITSEAGDGWRKSVVLRFLDVNELFEQRP